MHEFAGTTAWVDGSPTTFPGWSRIDVYDRGVTALSHPPSVPYVAGERQMLDAFLDAMRLAVRRKLEGITVEQARSTPTVSSLSLLAIVKHLAWTERRWFHDSLGDVIEDPRVNRDGGESDEFVVDNDGIEVVAAFYDEQCRRSRELAAGVADLDTVIVNERFGNRISFRWIMVHMIEETARHAGHADVIREAIDGREGD